MNLTFHDRAGAPTPKGDAAFTIGYEGAFTLNAVAVKALKLKVGGPALLVQDTDTNTWYLVFAKVEGREHFTLLHRNKKVTTALTFHSKPRAEAFFKASNINTSKQPSAKLRVELKPVVHEGLKLYPLVGIAPPVAPILTPPLLTGRPDEATLARLNRTVQQLGGMRLDKRPDAELTQALGLLKTHREWLPSLTGGTRLLEKLEAHFA